MKAAAICEGRLMPIHKCAKATSFIEYIWTWLEIEVIRIGEQSLRAKIFHRLGKNCLYICLRSDRDKGGSLNIAVRS